MVAPGGVRVRGRTDADLDVCVSVLADVHARDGYPVNWPDRPGTWLGPAGQLGAWVAELSGRVVGHVALSRGAPDDVAPGLWAARHGAPGDATAVVNRLYVAPGARGHRIGAVLLGHVTAEARRHSLHPVLDVVASDTSAVALYERRGWEPLGVTEQAWSPGGTVTVRSYAAPTADAADGR
ncbi:GNAT family N-acetyltransferase [Streptomyces sp. WMMC897]|nr:MULTISPECIES: GNAT family N-acetyltransferase [unclassified Streptomyces]MCZ7413816.1 GNAT family N-acetyltransferase [Streptomyces sp. WMMC897]MCZ7430812.1 GNAT family N-acetyltransferase [Streptomyces sp. WMMC1477]